MVIIVSTGAKVRSYCSKETSGLHVVLVLRENTELRCTLEGVVEFFEDWDINNCVQNVQLCN